MYIFSSFEVEICVSNSSFKWMQNSNKQFRKTHIFIINMPFKKKQISKLKNISHRQDCYFFLSTENS